MKLEYIFENDKMNVMKVFSHAQNIWSQVAILATFPGFAVLARRADLRSLRSRSIGRPFNFQMRADGRSDERTEEQKHTEEEWKTAEQEERAPLSDTFHLHSIVRLRFFSKQETHVWQHRQSAATCWTDFPRSLWTVLIFFFAKVKAVTFVKYST